MSRLTGWLGNILSTESQRIDPKSAIPGDEHDALTIAKAVPEPRRVRKVAIHRFTAVHFACARVTVEESVSPIRGRSCERRTKRSIQSFWT